jgi:flavodoxin
MNILVIYESKYGNTQKIAQAIAMSLRGYGTVQAMTADQADAFSLVNADDLDLVFAGCPTQIHKMTSAMRKFLDKIPNDALRGLPAVTFDTRYDSPGWMSGTAARGIARELYDKGAYVAAKPESFLVTEGGGSLQSGELDRAADWAQTVVERLVVPLV